MIVPGNVSCAGRTYCGKALETTQCPAYIPYPAKRFNTLVDAVLQQCRETLGVKQTEYASGADRLDNFHRQAVLQGVRPVEIGLTLLCKHITGLCLAVVKHPVDNWYWADQRGREGLKQRFVDAINYLLLLYALVDEAVGEVPDE